MQTSSLAAQDQPLQLAPYGAPVVLLSADPDLLELVDLAFADRAPMSWATSEQQLLAIILGEPVAAIIVDGTIADPITCCLRLRLAAPAPLLVIEAGSNTDERVRLLRAGADDVLARPCWPAELRARVEAKLRQVAWERKLPAPSLRVELHLLRALEREQGRFVPAATLRSLCAEDDMRPSRLDQHLRDLAARLDQLGLARLERGAGASYRFTWRHDGLAA
jgi:CheY-like chemotaxis protein